MTINVDLSEIVDLARNLDTAPVTAKRVSAQMVDKIANRLADDARRDVAVDTGDTRDLIHVEHDENSSTVIADSEAAFWLEFGTSDTAPQPFMWPNAPIAAERLQQALEGINPSTNHRAPHLWVH